MGRPARAIKRVAVLVRLEPDQWALIDKAAGKMPRHDWITKTLLAAADLGPPAEPVDPVTLADLEGIDLLQGRTVRQYLDGARPSKAKPAKPFKSRLKGEWKAP